MVSSSIKLLDEAFKGLSQPKTIDVDFVVDHLIRLAVEQGRIYLYGKNGKEVHVEVNDCKRAFAFDDCVGRFRMILARLCVRTQESFPRSFEGGLYGFDAQVCLTYGDNEAAELAIKTSNTLADNHLLIECG